MLTALILDTGVRLSEGFTMRDDQIDLARRIIDVEGSKGHRGKLKPRTVPIKRALLDRLTVYLDGRTGRLFPALWDGTPADKRKAGHRLTQRYRAAFDITGLTHLTEHDLRHEATCRWFELRKPDGGWVFSDIEVCRIMGWTDTKLALRYLSLRGEDLSAPAGRLLTAGARRLGVPTASGLRLPRWLAASQRRTRGGPSRARNRRRISP